MAIIVGFNLVDNASPVTRLELPAGKVDHQPSTKYLKGGVDPHDLSRIFKVGKYHEDTFTCEVHLTPEEYEALMDYIADATELRIEYTIGIVSNDQLQYIISEITKYPSRPDDMLEVRATSSFTLVSRYISTPSIVNPP